MKLVVVGGMKIWQAVMDGSASRTLMEICLSDDLNSTSSKISQIIYLPCWDYYYGDDDERKCYLAEVTEQLIAVQ